MNYTAGNFFGLTFYLPLLGWCILAILDGLGLCFRDTFYIARNRKRF